MSTSTTTVKRAARSDLTSAAIFYTVVLFLTGVIVYFIGYQQDNPDATILVVLIPTTVAVLITARTLGRAGVRRLLRLRGDSPWSARLLLTTALAIPTIALAAIFIGSTVTGQSSEFAMHADGLLILLVLVVIVIGEEYGFRGYMLPRLQSRYSALVAGIITGAAWWLWHYPPLPDWNRDSARHPVLAVWHLGGGCHRSHDLSLQCQPRLSRADDVVPSDRKRFICVSSAPTREPRRRPDHIQCLRRPRRRPSGRRCPDQRTELAFNNATHHTTSIPRQGVPIKQTFPPIHDEDHSPRSRQNVQSSACQR